MHVSINFTSSSNCPTVSFYINKEDGEDLCLSVC